VKTASRCQDHRASGCQGARATQASPLQPAVGDAV
jgi:hypothetical protein